MTVEKLRAANELMGRIEKAKECKAILESQNSNITISSESASFSVEDGPVKAQLVESVNKLIEDLEYDFKWFEIHWNDTDGNGD